MNHDDITDRLAEGEPLDARLLAGIRDRLASTAVPVKPLPSDPVLIGFLTVVFAAFTVALGYLSHMRALPVLSPLRMGFYYGFILAAAFLGAVVVVGEMIPGSRLRARGKLWILGTAIGISLLCVALFRSWDPHSFVKLGLPCYLLGSASGLGAGLLLSLFLRKGFLAFRRSAARVAGFLSALAGVGVLALHCPFLSVTHILVWHFGVLLTGWLLGDLIGRWMESR